MFSSEERYSNNKYVFLYVWTRNVRFNRYINWRRRSVPPVKKLRSSATLNQRKRLKIKRVYLVVVVISIYFSHYEKGSHHDFTSLRRREARVDLVHCRKKTKIGSRT